MLQESAKDLSELLEQAASLVERLGEGPTVLPVGERPSFLVAQEKNGPQPVIERIAAAGRLTFVVGAGASMEAGLPSWGSLVRNVLEAVAPSDLSEGDRAAWLGAVEASGLLGMAATARALAGSDRAFMKLVDHHVYRGKGADHFEPGPLAREIARWKQRYPEIEIATFNYDQLLEHALEDVGLTAQAVENAGLKPDGVAVVRHLHGKLSGVPSNDAVVLTESDYALWTAGSWQDEFMASALEGLCVFVGLSFTDQNLLRWIYGAGGSDHVAVLSRQSAPRLSRPVRAALEAATRRRLQAANVTAYWADFYAELAQLLHEARRRRGPGAPPRPYLERARKRVAKGRRRCLPSTNLEARQRKVREILAGSLAGVRAAVKSVGVEVDGAVLGLGLWGIDYDQRAVMLWASSDRIHVDLSTASEVPLEWGSEWVAVEAITRGAVVERNPSVYASRWRSVRGIPLVWTGPQGRERLLVGAATLTTTESAGTSVFDRAEEHAPGIRKTIDVELHDQLVRLWD
jgi:SIR2-like protein